MNETKSKILVVDDDLRLRQLLERYLSEQGFTVKAVPDAPGMDRALERELYDLIVLDLMLPGEDGLAICRRLRGTTNPISIIMLTAKGDEVDRIVGLEVGADDYLPKPFSPRELVARVRALLRRAAMPRPSAPGFELDETGQRIRYDGHALALTRLEYGLLRELLLARGRILSRQTLFDRVWGSQAEAADRTVDTHIKTLRAKLRERRPGGDPIVTHRGLGYQLED